MAIHSMHDLLPCKEALSLMNNVTRVADSSSDDIITAAAQGYAVKAGMMVARGLLLLMMDADGATRVSDLGKLETELHKLTHPDSESSPLFLCKCVVL